MTVKKADLATPQARGRQRLALTGWTAAEAQRIEQELVVVERHIELIGQEIRREFKDDPKPTTAMAFLAHVGDASRFSRASQVSHFVGMTPRVDSSGETTRTGSITKKGCSAIRGLIVQAAWSAVHSSFDHRLKRKHQELAARRGKGRAIVANSLKKKIRGPEA